jgi:glutamate formiminotransferase/formiminotetrahydrofolate cyclodeaminase
MAEKGNPASISDVGVGALATRACIEGAAMNVRINLSSLQDEKFKSSLQQKVRELRTKSDREFKKIFETVEAKLG